MHSALKQMPTFNTSDTNVRYLFVDDMNQLVTETLTTMELSEITDAEYVSHNDQMLLIDLMKRRLASNQELLSGRNKYY